VKKAGTSTGAVVPVVIAAHQSGISLPIALAIGLGLALVVFLVWKFKPKPTQAIEDTPHPALIAPVEQPK
jgi:hypothetical protein